MPAASHLWFPAIEQYIASVFTLEQQDEDSDIQQTQECIEALHDLFIKAARHAQIRDSFGDTRCYTSPYGVDIIELSKRLDTAFTLGASIYGYHLQAPIPFPELIRFMTDEFWQHIAALQTIGRAELQNDCRPQDWEASNPNRALARHSKSLVFAISRDYVLLSQAEESCNTLGEINLALDIHSDSDTLFSFVSTGLQHLYRAYYLLWKWNYQNNHRKMRTKVD